MRTGKFSNGNVSDYGSGGGEGVHKRLISLFASYSSDFDD